MECLEQAWTLPSQPKKCQTHTSQGYRGQILWGSQGNFPGAQPALQLIFRQRGPHSTPECTAKTQNLCKLRPELLGLGLCQTLNSRSLGSHRCVHRDICHGVGEQTFVRRIQVDICQRQNVVRKKKKSGQSASSKKSQTNKVDRDSAPPWGEGQDRIRRKCLFSERFYNDGVAIKQISATSQMT